MSMSKIISGIEREMFDRETGKEKTKCCQNCKWYNLNEYIEDERGKHECYGHNLICSPICLGYEIDKENNCDKFEPKGNETLEEIERQWRMNGFSFERDKSTELLVNAMLKRENQNGDA